MRGLGQVREQVGKLEQVGELVVWKPFHLVVVVGLGQVREELGVRVELALGSLVAVDLQSRCFGQLLLGHNLDLVLEVVELRLVVERELVEEEVLELFE